MGPHVVDRLELQLQLQLERDRHAMASASAYRSAVAFLFDSFYCLFLQVCIYLLDFRSHNSLEITFVIWLGSLFPCVVHMSFFIFANTTFGRNLPIHTLSSPNSTIASLSSPCDVLWWMNLYVNYSVFSSFGSLRCNETSWCGISTHCTRFGTTTCWDKAKHDDDDNYHYYYREEQEVRILSTMARLLDTIWRQNTYPSHARWFSLRVK